MNETKNPGELRKRKECDPTDLEVPKCVDTGKPLNEILKECPWAKTIAISELVESVKVKLHSKMCDQNVIVYIKNETNLESILGALDQLRQFEKLIIDTNTTLWFDDNNIDKLVNVECQAIDIDCSAWRYRDKAHQTVLNMAKKLIINDNRKVNTLSCINIFRGVGAIRDDMALQLHQMGSCVRMGYEGRWINTKNARWRQRLWSLVELALLEDNQQSAFHKFLLKGVYDPRLLIIIGSMLATLDTFLNQSEEFII